MAFNINEFRNQITGDGARPNLFEVRLSAPGYAQGGGDVNRKLSFMCNSAQLPGSTIGIAPAFYFGREVKLAGNRTYPEWTIQIINDEDFMIRNVMENWVNGIQSPTNLPRLPDAAVVDGGYGVDATVIQYAKTGEIIKTYDFKGMFPIDVSPIEVNWGANDQIEEFSVTLAFQYWTSSSASVNTAENGVSGLVSGLDRARSAINSGRRILR